MTTSRFVGRAAELAAIDAVLDEVVARRTPAVVDLRGDPGIGKSRLAANAAGRARRAGFTVLEGQAGELEREVPFGILVDTFGDHARRARRPHGQLDATTAVELDLAEDTLTRVRRGGPPVERLAIHRAVRSLLAWLAAPRPLLAVLDDLHWADESSLALIGYLLRRPPPAPVVLVLVHRQRQSPAALTTALDLASAELRAERLELGPLTVAEVAELTGASAAMARRLVAHSAGNPFVLEAIGHEAGRHGPVDHLSGTDLPGRVNSAVLAEVYALADCDLVVARAAAVAGDPFDLAVAAAAAGVDADAADESLDRLVAADLVRRLDARRLCFRHPIVRGVIYRSAPASWRRAAHRRLAVALQRWGAPAEGRAHLVAVTATPGDRSAGAVDRLDRALSLARQSGQQFLVPPIQASAAFALVDAGRVSAATQTAEDAFDGAVLLGNRYFEALGAAVCSYALLAAGDVDAAIEWGRRSVAADPHVGPLVAANLGLHLANALLAAGHAGEAAEVLLGATNGGDLSPVEPVQHPWYHELLALIAIELGDREGARRWVSAASEAVRGVEFPRAQMHARRAAATVALADGDPATAATAASAAADCGDLAGMPLDAARARLLAGRALAATGDHRAAVHELTCAERTLADCGARRWRDQAATELRCLGARPRRERRAGRGPLSARELQVAELVTRGMANRAIGAALFISENTVETHLRRIYAKLGIRSRAAVARALTGTPAGTPHEIAGRPPTR